MKRKCKKLGQGGFTLIEVMMAMVILAIGIVSIVALQTKNMEFNTGSKKQSEGYNWAMDQIEHLLATPYDGPYTPDTNLAVGGPYSVAQGPYNVVWNVVDNSINVANSKAVDLVINWNNKQVATLKFTRTQESF